MYAYGTSGNAKDGEKNGGAGGNSKNSNDPGGSGAGNPFGLSEILDHNAVKTNDFGTGGLLIIYSNNILNNGSISCNGKTGGDSFNAAGGGASGGGSLNMFYINNYKNNGKITSDGGSKSKSAPSKGGAGGNGSISIGQLLNGTYTSTYTNY